MKFGTVIVSESGEINYKLQFYYNLKELKVNLSQFSIFQLQTTVTDFWFSSVHSAQNQKFFAKFMDRCYLRNKRYAGYFNLKNKDHTDDDK